VTWREMSLVEQVETLLQIQLHAAFVNMPFIPEGLQGLALLKDAFVCCLLENHPLAGKSEIGLIELAGARTTGRHGSVPPYPSIGTFNLSSTNYR
jgi:DNA-binding transcriptional LysR family regulator